MQHSFFVKHPRPTTRGPTDTQSFTEFEATELYCPKCGRSTPVRKRLLLVLPQGEKYEYLCAFCATSVGSKVVRGTEQVRIII